MAGFDIRLENPGTGIDFGLHAVQVSKAVAYAVVTTPQPSVNVSKAVAYAVTTTEAKIAVSKALAYAVIRPKRGGRPILIAVT